MASQVVDAASAARLMLNHFHRDPPEGQVLRTEMTLRVTANMLVAEFASRGVRAINLGLDQCGRYVVCLAGHHIEVEEAYEALRKTTPPSLRLVKST